MSEQGFVVSEESVVMNSVELILAIKEYAKRQGVDFEIALKMLGMMYEDGVHLEGGYDE